MSIGTDASMTPVRPPRTNTKKNPSTNSIGDFRLTSPSHNVAIQQNTWMPLGMAIMRLAAVKNVGRNAIESITSARKEIGRFTSIFEFCEKVDLRMLNKRVLESLIKAGAMDDFGYRSQIMAVLDKAIERAQKAQRDAEMGQHGLFGVFEEEQSNGSGEKLPSVPEWDEHQRLASAS